MARITIVTVCHDYGRYLRECLESVHAQTYKDFEYILVDAASTDNTKEIAQQFPATRYLWVDRYPGYVSIRNIGFRSGTGEYCVSLDADDKLHPQYLEKLVASAAPGIIVCPQLSEFGGNRTVTFHGEGLHWKISFGAIPSLAVLCFPGWTSMLSAGTMRTWIR